MHASRTFIIAEAGVNHNGSIDLAKRLIDVAAEAGADAVKFQTFKAAGLVSQSAPRAAYQIRNTAADETQLEMLKRLELNAEAHHTLLEHSRACGIELLSTAFDLESLYFLVNELGITKIKIPSGDITYGPMLLAAARLTLPVILSTGMSTLAEIEAALAVLAFGYTQPLSIAHPDAFRQAYLCSEGQAALIEKVTLLHCTTEYPAPVSEVNLRVLDTLRQAFGLTVGFSDHTEGIAIPTAAVARGACLIEKHFTLDRNLPGPDHLASLEPRELIAMVQAIRQVEMALGCGRKMPGPAEEKNRLVARRSLVAARAIRKGEPFTEQNLTAKRPGVGISPMMYWTCLGQTAQKDYASDESIV